MNPIIFALRHPFTILVACVALVGGAVLAVQRMNIDIFPELNLPVPAPHLGRACLHQTRE
jgi:multidrug efflux pump subunit AcrB